jgi:hypothetical protein
LTFTRHILLVFQNLVYPKHPKTMMFPIQHCTFGWFWVPHDLGNLHLEVS